MGKSQPSMFSIFYINLLGLGWFVRRYMIVIGHLIMFFRDVIDNNNILSHLFLLLQ